MSRVSTQKCVEAGLLAGAAALLAIQAGRTAAGLQASGAWWMVPVVVALGVACADFATGVLHWLGDRFFEERTPILGALLIRPFREHHSDPQAMLRHGFLELHANSAIPTIALLGAAQLLDGNPTSAVSAALELWLLAFCASGMAANQLHLWAHAPTVPRLVRCLQRSGVILSPERHALHHAGRFDRSYCVTSGWLNPLLDRADFFGRIERALRALQGVVRR
ncbi:MAG TPA: fatty acid desaturase CarF family protein [Myxococcota bacterium]|nr:fatty acid desaturase CarF family protein [Myxococcota bacterium]